MQTQKCLVVEGNIGAGKTTFLNLLSAYLDVHLVYEPLRAWQAVGGTDNLLDLFYKDTPRWSYTFQSYAFVTRVSEHEKARREIPHKAHILERSVYSDRYCFAKNCYEIGKMTSLEWKLYQEWFAWLVDQYITKPDGFIYLKTDPEVCYKRLLKRNREEEAAVPLTYLQSIHGKHEEWLVQKEGVADYLKDTPVLELECNKDFETDLSEQQKHISDIITFFGLATDQVLPAFEKRLASL